MVDGDWGTTMVAGADLTLYWSPLERAKYRSFIWRSEGYLLQKEIPGHTWQRGIGAYSYLQTQLGPSWYIGLRGDWVRPVAGTGWENADGVIEDFVREDLWRATPYVTFWQSEFVYLRGEYWYTLGLDDQVEHRILFQIDWAAGPHKHEKY